LLKLLFCIKATCQTLTVKRNNIACFESLFNFYPTDPIRAYFWPAVNKRPTRLWPGYFLTQPEEIFWSHGKKFENLDVFRGNFPNPNSNYRWLTRPNPSHKKLTRTHHYIRNGIAILPINYRYARHQMRKPGNPDNLEVLHFHDKLNVNQFKQQILSFIFSTKP